MPETKLRAGNRRVAALNALGLLNDTHESRFDRVLGMAVTFFGLSSAALVLVGRDQMIIKARHGLDVATPNLDGSFTEAVMTQQTIFVIEDATQDERFACSPMVLGEPFVRLYVGQPLHAPGGEAIGVLAMSGRQARPFGDGERLHFGQVVAWLEEELAHETESKRAAAVQQALQPRHSIDLAGYDVAGASTPARAVGGDFFDWYPTPDGLGFTLADVMGKGVGAALIAATVRAVIRTSARDSGVRNTVSRAARILDDDLSDTDSFATLFHAKLRQSDGRVRYVDAGHGLTLVVRADGRSEHLAHEDLPLGTAFGHEWHRHTVRLGVGDTLITFSDGVLDLFDGTTASLADVADVVRHTASATEAVRALTILAEQHADTDDVVVIAIRRTHA